MSNGLVTPFVIAPNPFVTTEREAWRMRSDTSGDLSA